MRRSVNYIEVLVFSAHSLVRKEIISTLSGEAEIRVKGLATNIIELGERIAELNPHVVIINDDDHGLSSLGAIKLINQITNNAKILLLIKDYDDEKELTALKMGVRGFLPESVGKAAFIKCVRAINDGEMWVRRKVMEKLIQQLLNRTSGNSLRE